MNKIALAVRASYLLSSDQIEQSLLQIADTCYDLLRSLNKTNEPEKYEELINWVLLDFQKLRESYLAVFKLEDQEEADQIFFENAAVKRVQGKLETVVSFIRER